MAKKTVCVVLVLLFSFACPAWAGDSGEPGQPGDVKKQESGEQKFKDDFAEVWSEVEDTTGPLKIGLQAIGFYQYTNDVTIAGNHYKDHNSAGFLLNNTYLWNPFENSEFYFHIWYAQGGVNDTIQKGGGVFSETNSINDGAKQNGIFKVKQVIWTQKFFDKKAFVSFGRIEQESFLDGNEYANDSYSQFVSTIFNNDPVFDSEDFRSPGVAVGGDITKDLHVVVLSQVSTDPNSYDGEKKSEWDDWLDDPFFGGQLKYTADIGGRKGAYRFFGWVAPYEHAVLDSNSTADGWGVCLNFDQEITEKFGIFGRFGYHNPEVYQSPWLVSGGFNWQGIFPSRDRDVWGLGLGAMSGNSRTGNSEDWECHLETYYKIQVTDFFHVSPGIQVIPNPLANPNNDTIFAGTVRFALDFETP